MKVTQPDSRTISILSDNGIRIFLPYRFYWNGHERPAESIVLTTSRKQERSLWEVRAFFLFGEMRDAISEDAAGVILRRTWQVKTAGAFHLSIQVEMPGAQAGRWFFPGVQSGEDLPRGALSFLGEKTSLPCAVTLSDGVHLCHFFSRSAWSEGSVASIGVARRDSEEEGPRLLVEMRFPGIEEPRSRIGPRPRQQAAAVEETIESPGALDRTHEAFLVFADADSRGLEGHASAVARLAARPAPAQAPAAGTRRLSEELQASLSGHLLERGGVAGIREHPGSPWLSSSAGAGYAVALRRLFPRDQRLCETALRLADFSLKGQTASGFFYESFHAGTGRWQGVRGREGEPVLSLGQSALVAERLLILSRDLADSGLPHEKYYLAGLRFVDFFFDEKSKLVAPGSLHAPDGRVALDEDPGNTGGLELLFPMALVFEKSGKDRYRKALEALVNRFSGIGWDPFNPPSSRVGRSADSAGALLAVRLFLAMRSLGFRPAEQTSSSAAASRAQAAASARLFASLVVPWIRVHPAEDSGFPGCLVDSYTCQRVVFRSRETALLLLRLRAHVGEAELKSLLRNLARLCLDAARGVPIGSSFAQHTRWDADGKPDEGRGRRGPIDARRLATEVLAGLDLAEEFPKI